MSLRDLLLGPSTHGRIPTLQDTGRHTSSRLPATTSLPVDKRPNIIFSAPTLPALLRAALVAKLDLLQADPDSQTKLGDPPSPRVLADLRLAERETATLPGVHEYNYTPGFRSLMRVGAAIAQDAAPLLLPQNEDTFGWAEMEVPFGARDEKRMDLQLRQGFRGLGVLDLEGKRQSVGRFGDVVRLVRDGGLAGLQCINGSGPGMLQDPAWSMLAKGFMSLFHVDPPRRFFILTDGAESILVYLHRRQGRYAALVSNLEEYDDSSFGLISLSTLALLEPQLDLVLPIEMEIEVWAAHEGVSRGVQQQAVPGGLYETRAAVASGRVVQNPQGMLQLQSFSAFLSPPASFQWDGDVSLHCLERTNPNLPLSPPRSTRKSASTSSTASTRKSASTSSTASTSSADSILLRQPILPLSNGIHAEFTSLYTATTADNSTLYIKYGEPDEGSVRREACLYEQLTQWAKEGVVIAPVFFGFFTGVMNDNEVEAIALEDGGASLFTFDTLSQPQKEQTLSLLELLHARGYEHGDFAPRNTLISAQGIRLIDFARARPHDNCDRDQCEELCDARSQLGL